jgi:hypothetical protein
VIWTFCPDWPGTVIFPISASLVTWDDGHMPLQPVTGWGWVFQTISLAWSQTMILSISVSQVARITGYTWFWKRQIKRKIFLIKEISKTKKFNFHVHTTQPSWCGEALSQSHNILRCV